MYIVDDNFVNSIIHSNGRVIAYEYVIDRINNKLGKNINDYSKYDIKSIATLCLLMHQSIYDSHVSCNTINIDDIINTVCDTLIC